MLLTNKTTVTLEILGKEIKPNESQIFTESRFNELIVKSDIGYCVIRTKSGKHYFTNSGRLIASEGNIENRHGRKPIIISSVD